MHALKVCLLVASIVVVIAGCSGLNAPTQPTGAQQVSQGPEFLYVATSKPGLLTFQVQPGGSLKAVATSASVPDSVCSAALSPAPGKIYSLSQLCPFSDDPLELRRFDLGPSGDIISGAGPFSLGPGLPSGISRFLGFIAAPESNFAYAWTFDNDGREYITPIQIDAGGNLNAKPELGISWPIHYTSIVECEFHAPKAVITTSEGMFLKVIDSQNCGGAEGPSESYLFFQLDSQTGAIGSLSGEAKIDPPPDLSRLFTAQNGALMVVGGPLGPGGSGSLKLFHVGMDGVTLAQECQSDQPACAHSLAAAFHPSGRWLFVSDMDANGIAHGIWTIPIVRGSLMATRASFVALPDGVYKFAFSSDGKSLYVGQWVNNKVSGQISGFRVDDNTGVLTAMADSPWDLGIEFFVTSMVHAGARSR
jgi:hypothetical protein